MNEIIRNNVMIKTALRGLQRKKNKFKQKTNAQFEQKVTIEIRKTNHIINREVVTDYLKYPLRCHKICPG